MRAIRIPKLKCYQCGHDWIPKISKPNWCPSCGSIHWNDKDYKLKNTGRPRTKQRR